MCLKSKQKNNLYAVDRIEDGIVIIENTTTNKIKEVTLEFEVQEGDILEYKNNEFILNESEKEKREKRIREKFERLRR